MRTIQYRNKWIKVIRIRYFGIVIEAIVYAASDDEVLIIVLAKTAMLSSVFEGNFSNYPRQQWPARDSVSGYHSVPGWVSCKSRPETLQSGGVQQPILFRFRNRIESWRIEFWTRREFRTDYDFHDFHNRKTSVRFVRRRVFRSELITEPGTWPFSGLVMQTYGKHLRGFLY